MPSGDPQYCSMCGGYDVVGHACITLNLATPNVFTEEVCGTCCINKSNCTCVALGKGAKNDHGKNQWRLIPLRALTAIVRVLTIGAKKYGPENWRNVPNAKERYTDALWRHITAWQMGETIDTDTGEHHLACAGCCLLFLLELEVQ